MMAAEPLAIGASLLHRLDPRAKIAAAIVWSVGLAVLTDLHVLAGGLLVSAALLASARPPLGALWRRLLAINVFVAFLWLFLPWSVPGEEIVAWGPVIVTRAGLLLALRLTLRCNAIAWACIALLGTSRLSDLTVALRNLGLPQKLALLLFFCVRHIRILYEEYGRLRAAMMLRAFTPRTTLHTYRAYANLVGLLFVRSHDRAGRVYEAMVCRGFDGQLRGARSGRWRYPDAAFAALAAVATMTLVVWECLKTAS
ncbi:MAG: cobalt ECF transporter T component CbiQ [Planctomycetes bacterium]|nr:cobalt ECF transporter T component CbiQ [Planctomycetota bacterium]